MGNPYLDAYRSSGGTGGAPSGGKSGGSNPYLSSYRVKQLPQVMADISTPKPAPQPKQQAPQQNQNWFEKGLAGVGKAFTTDLGKNVGDILGVGKSTFVDPAAKLYQQINAGQAVNNHQGGTPTVDQHLLDNQNTEIARALKAGEINQQKADQLHQKVSNAFTKTQQSYKQAQQDTGTKFNRDEGANALIDTVSNLGGVEGLIKGGVKVAAKAGTSLFDKMTGKTVAKEIVPKDVAPPTIAPPAPKPSPTLFDKMKPPKAELLNVNTARPVQNDTPTPTFGSKIKKDSFTGTPKTNGTVPEVAPPKDTQLVEPKVTDAKTYTVKEVNHDGSKSGESQTVHFPSDESVNSYRTKKAELNASGSGFTSGKSDIVVKDAGGNEFSRTPYDKAVQKYGTTDPHELAHKIVNGDVSTASETTTKQDLKTATAETPTAPVVSETKPPTDTPVTDGTQTGDTVSGNSARIQQNALEKKLTQNMGDLPQYKSINMKDQAKQAVDFVNNDRQGAIDVINGKTNPPDGLHPQSVHQALELTATKEGNGELLTQLAKSHINTELSQGAQKLRIAAERDPHSPVEQIRQIQEARQKVAERRAGTTVAKETVKATDAVAKATRITTKEDLHNFIQGLVC